MPLFNNDPLLGVCRVLAWAIFGLAACTFVFAVCAALMTLVAGESVEAILRRSYPDMMIDGLQPLFFVLMALVAVAMALGVRFMLYLLAIIASVRAGEAFTAFNAARIRGMAWLSLAGMPVGFFLAPIQSRVVDLLGAAPDGGHFRIASPGGFDFGQIMLTLLLFVLARLFTQAAAMRDDIEGTV